MHVTKLVVCQVPLFQFLKMRAIAAVEFVISTLKIG